MACYRGSAIANTVSQFSLAGILYVYIMWKGLHKATWGGENNSYSTQQLSVASIIKAPFTLGK